MLKIFIVEDELSLRKLYRMIFENAGFTILGFSCDGQKVVSDFKALSEKPDLILMDYRMPIKDGVEAELERYKEKLEELNKELEQRIEYRTKKLRESRKKYRDLYKLASFYKDLFAHDINNIFHSILFSVQLCLISLKDDGISYNYTDLLEIAKEQVNRGVKLIRNIQKLLNLEKKKTISIPTYIYPLLNKDIVNISNDFQGKRINLIVNPTHDDIIVHADEFLLDVFENILNNAVKHNNSEVVEIKIKISKLQKDDGNFLKIEFIDNGRRKSKHKYMKKLK